VALGCNLATDHDRPDPVAWCLRDVVGEVAYASRDSHPFSCPGSSRCRTDLCGALEAPNPWAGPSMVTSAFIRTCRKSGRNLVLGRYARGQLPRTCFWTARRSILDRLDETERRVRAGVHRICDSHATMRKRYFSNRVNVCTRERAQVEAPPKPWESETRERCRSSGNRNCSRAARSSKSSSSPRSLARRSGTFCETFSIIARRRRTT
jgi:hypothetical protein